MKKSQKLKNYTRLILAISCVIFLLLIAMEILPLLPNSTLDSFRLLGQQRSLSLRMVKDSLTLAYRPANEHAEALDELQKSIGPWEQTQTEFLNGTRGTGMSSQLPSDSFLLIQQSQSDYASIDAALRKILANPNNIDPLQIEILISHSNPYFLSMSQALNLLQVDIENTAHGYFFFELTFELVLAFCIVFYIFFTRRFIENKEEYL